MNEHEKDLSELAVGAHVEVEKQSRKAAAGKPRLGPRARAALAAGGAVVGIFATYVYAGPYLLGLGDREMREQLVAIVNAARDDVERARKAKGSLPESIGNMALAMVVEYRPRDGGYRLVASDGYHQVELDDAGKLSESRIPR